MSFTYATARPCVGTRELPPTGGPTIREVEQGPVPEYLLPREKPVAVKAPGADHGKEKKPPTPPPPTRARRDGTAPTAAPRLRAELSEAADPNPPCPRCGGKNHSKGLDRDGQRRYVCVVCRKTNRAGAPLKPTKPCVCGREARRHGTSGRDGRPRWRCPCGSTWIEPSGEPSKRGDALRAVWAGRSAEERAAHGRKAAAARLAVQTPEARQEGSKKRLATLGPEKRSEIARKARAALARQRAASAVPGEGESDG